MGGVITLLAISLGYKAAFHKDAMKPGDFESETISYLQNLPPFRKGQVDLSGVVALQSLEGKICALTS
jgi:hypothetical protein